MQTDNSQLALADHCSDGLLGTCDEQDNSYADR